MGKQAPVKKIRTSTGKVYTKKKAPEGSGKDHLHFGPGGFVSAQSFGTAEGNVTRGRGEVIADQNRWEPDAEVTVPTPDGDKQVEWTDASKAGELVAGSGARETVTIDGETYDKDEMTEAFGNARVVDGQVVRY